MTNIAHYIQSNRIINVYLENIDLLRDYSEYQHFMSRLDIIRKRQTPQKYFLNIVNDLEESINSSADEVVEKLLCKDTKGFLKKICATGNKEIFKYLYLTHISDLYSICIRNNVKLDKDVQEKISSILSNDNTVDFLCRVCKNSELRKYEGTWCANGIGYVLFYIEHNEQNKQKLFVALCDIYKYYLSNFNINNRDSVYGLTHCILQFSMFYTKDVYKNDFCNNEVVKLFLDTIKVIETAFNSIDKVKSMSSDMIAELLVVYKMLDKNENRYTSLAYNELVRRINPKYNIIVSTKNDDFTQLLKLNEHTNILFVLYCRLELR